MQPLRRPVGSNSTWGRRSVALAPGGGVSALPGVPSVEGAADA